MSTIETDPPLVLIFYTRCGDNPFASWMTRRPNWRRPVSTLSRFLWLELRHRTFRIVRVTTAWQTRVRREYARIGRDKGRPHAGYLQVGALQRQQLEIAAPFPHPGRSGARLDSRVHSAALSSGVGDNDSGWLH